MKSRGNSKEDSHCLIFQRSKSQLAMFVAPRLLISQPKTTWSFYPGEFGFSRLVSDDQIAKGKCSARKVVRDKELPIKWYHRSSIFSDYEIKLVLKGI